MRLIALTVSVVAVVVGACAEKVHGPTLESVAGNYSATTFATTSSGTTTDWLTNGASISLGLTVAGTTSGRVIVPGEGEEPGTDFEADLAGTWKLSADSVRFYHDADTFLRDVAFRVISDDLVSEDAIGAVEFHVVLRKQQR